MSSIRAKTTDKAENKKGAIIVPFPVEQTRAPKCCDEQKSKSAQIIFFLGVRYDKLINEEEQQQSVKPLRGKAQKQSNSF